MKHKHIIIFNGLTMKNAIKQGVFEFCLQKCRIPYKLKIKKHFSAICFTTTDEQLKRLQRV